MPFVKRNTNITLPPAIANEWQTWKGLNLTPEQSFCVGRMSALGVLPITTTPLMKPTTKRRYRRRIAKTTPVNGTIPVVTKRAGRPRKVNAQTIHA